MLCSNYACRRTSIHYECYDKNVVRTFSIKYAFTILKEIPEDLLESHTGTKRQTISQAKPQQKRGFSKRTTSPKKQVSSSDWKVGDKVTHKAWGEGMVSNVNEKMVQ